MVFNPKYMQQRVKTNKDGEIYHPNYQENVMCTADGSETILDQFISTASKFEQKSFLGSIVNNELKWQTYGEIRAKVEKLASFFNDFITSSDIVGIYSVNRYEWLVSEYAGYMLNCKNCPLYSTFGLEAIKLVVEESEMKLCLVSSDKAKSLIEVLKICEKSKLKIVVIYDDVCDDESAFLEYGIKVYYFNKIMQTQKITSFEHKPCSSDIATLCYTSGTSGIPKGVMLTHKNFVASIAAFFRSTSEEEYYNVSDQEIYLSYLPLAHVMERIVVAVIMSAGGSIGFYRGNPKEIQQDYLIIKPTFIIAVPRVLNLFKQKIESKLSEKSFIIRNIVSLALKYKVWRQSYGVVKSPILDYLIFNKISKEFGGNIRACLCGSAPLKPEVLSFLQGVLSVNIFQGYGQTETTGATLLKPLDYVERDNVGIPFPSNKLKLKRVPGYDEYSGELLVKGDNVTCGYYRRPEETKKLFDEDGWLKTGDIVRFKNGVFTIIGRCKEIFKTSFGEYIVPEKIENLFIGGIIEDMFVTCSMYSNKLVCIVVCRDKNTTKEDIMKCIQSRGDALVREKKMAKFEIPSNVIIIRDGFETFSSAELLTATAKKKRNNIEMFFKKELSDILDE